MPAKQAQLLRTEREIWGLEPQFLISYGHSGSASLRRATSPRLTWNQKPQRRQLRVTITRFASKLRGALSFQRSPWGRALADYRFRSLGKSALECAKLLIWWMVCHFTATTHKRSRWQTRT